MSVKCIHPYTPLLYSKTGVCRGIPIFLIFAPKPRFWVLVRTAILPTAIHILVKIFNFYNIGKFSILHGRVFIM